IPVVIKEKAIANLNNPSYKLNSDNIIFYGEAVIGNTYTKLAKYLKPNSSALYYNFDSANQNLKDAVKPVKS
ncbi:MAG: hypothetical protein DI548_16960, partial [Flavobacterium johnsoniae]